MPLRLRRIRSRLRDLAAPPAVLHVIGGVGRLSELLAGEPVAVVGARQAVALRGGDRRRPRTRTGLRRRDRHQRDGAGNRLRRSPRRARRRRGDGRRAGRRRRAGLSRPRRAGCIAASRSAGHSCPSWGRGPRTRRWMFLARNRIIAALSAMTVVVQGRAASGALVTARRAAELGRTVGAVPGPVTSRLSAGPHELLRGGAELVQGAQDVLDGLFGAGAPALADRRREPLSPRAGGAAARRSPTATRRRRRSPAPVSTSTAASPVWPRWSSAAGCVADRAVASRSPSDSDHVR